MYFPCSYQIPTWKRYKTYPSKIFYSYLKSFNLYSLKMSCNKRNNEIYVECIKHRHSWACSLCSCSLLTRQFQTHHPLRNKKTIHRLHMDEMIFCGWLSPVICITSANSKNLATKRNTKHFCLICDVSHRIKQIFRLCSTFMQIRMSVQY